MPSPLSGACSFPAVLKSTGSPVLHDLPHFYVADPVKNADQPADHEHPEPLGPRRSALTVKSSARY